uniref:Uncharacterized protein n=1 Tax=Anguilla anguilla TaxID=7936 RepID=A0A0E9S552_ANGAN
MFPKCIKHSNIYNIIFTIFNTEANSLARIVNVQ